jgi:hypothetical protein
MIARSDRIIAGAALVSRGVVYDRYRACVCRLRVDSSHSVELLSRRTSRIIQDLHIGELFGH